jgi:hypothetical protein
VRLRTLLRLPADCAWAAIVKETEEVSRRS